jgi:hypothetical protein
MGVAHHNKGDHDVMYHSDNTSMLVKRSQSCTYNPVPTSPMDMVTLCPWLGAETAEPKRSSSVATGHGYV